MKKACILLATAVLVGFWATSTPLARGEDGPPQGLKGSATGFELNMRILEGSREKPAGPAKPVTSSFLKFLNFVNVDFEQDLQAEQQIKKIYNLKDVSLLTEASLVWEKGKSEKALHMFRLNGQEYLVIVTPGRLIEKDQFRIEVYEQSQNKKTNLLDTEFNLPAGNAAVFGFEDTALKPYFIALRVTGWSGTLGGVVGGVLRGGQEAKVMPPKLVRQVDPVYPEVARKAGVEGRVILEATTDTYGRVANVKVLRSIPLLDQAAVDAARQWVYEPMVIDGKPRPVTFTLTMDFKLDGKKKPQAGGVLGGVIGGVGGGVAGGVQGGVSKGVEGGVAGGVVGGVLGGVTGGQDAKQFQGDAVRAKNDIKAPMLLKYVPPLYPEIARKAQVEGTVILEAKTDEKGNVIDARVLRSIPLLDQAAIDAVKQWKYQPMTIDGKPRKVVLTVTVKFRLDEKDKAGQVGPLDKFAEGAVRAEKDIEPPKLVREVQPIYPEIARQSAVEGNVILGVKTDEEGRVKDVILLRSIPLLDQAAIDAVRQWVYEPFVKEGKAVPVVFTVTVRFQLK